MKRVWGTLFLLSCSLSWCAGADVEGALYYVRERGPVEKGIRSLDGADGCTAFSMRGDARCLSNKSGAAPRSSFLYFDVDDAVAKDAKGPLYVEVQYYDGEPGGVIQLQYDSATGDSLGAKYLASESQWGAWSTGRHQWRKAVFLIEKPLFANRQNLGADFRLGGAELFVRSVRLSLSKPKGCERLDRMSRADLRARVKIGRGGELIIGGFDPARKEDVRQQVQSLTAAAPLMKSIGVTSHEGYVRWNLCEPEQGRYDWSVYDAYVEVYRKYGLKWVPFLIVGSAYSLPDWYYKKPGSQGYVCLEHGEECDVQSLWNPVLRDHVSRFIKAFCDHYRDTGVIESILLGVTGNYGEAIYVATGNDWTADIHGQYHTHPGFWAGDKYAVEDFQKRLERKYGKVENLGQAWGTTVAGFDVIKPFLKKDAPNDRAWLDFCDWYIGSMTEWSRFWLQETRKNFPKGEIYLCTGGHAPAEHGSNFGDQCKVAAEVGGGVRITNEGSDYKGNFSLTRWVASAGRQYGAYFSFEPAGVVKPEAVSARIYNATASGARGLHYYYPNLFSSKEATGSFVRWGKQFKQREPIVEIAVYYPQTFIKLNGNEFLGLLQPLRDRFDFGFMSDEQIRDGGLASVKALILLDGNTSESDIWNRVVEWVRNGGLLLYADGIGRLRTVEGDERFHEMLFGAHADVDPPLKGPQGDVGKGRAVVFHGASKEETYRAFLTDTLRSAPELSPATRRMLDLDGVEDGVFVTLCASNELLWLNATDKEMRRGRKRLPAHSIVLQ